MPATYEYEVKNGYAQATTQGTISTMDDVMTYVQSLIEDTNRMDMNNLLLDHRKVTGDLDTLKSFNFAVKVTNKVVGMRALRLAIVAHRERMEFLKFFETAAQNRGMMVVGFDSMEEALRWIKG